MTQEKKVVEIIKENREALLELCCSLVNIPTPNPPGDGYEKFVNFLSHWFSQEGLNAEVISIPENELSSLLPKECHGPRAFFQASLEGKETGPTLYLQGHYDTIPPTQHWTRSPYKAEVEGERIWGLGTSDMKGALASMMIAMKALARAGGVSHGRVIFLATPDEEYASGTNIRYLFSKGKVSGDFAVVGEFSGVGNLFVGMKGGIWGDLRVKGKAVHGSQPSKGINACEKLAMVMYEIEKNFKPKLFMKKSSYAFIPPEYDFPTVMIGGMLRGSNVARSAVPDIAEASFDLRTVPEDRDGKLVDDFRGFLVSLTSKDPELDLELHVASQFPAYAESEDSPLIQVFQRVIAQQIGSVPSLSISCAATEAAFFAQGGIPAIAYGPGIWQTAHAKDEFVLIEDLETASLVYAQTAMSLLSGGENSI
jgi:succinyl-diaminopimelate desuccinylase